MDKDRPPPAMGGGRAANGQLLPSRETANDTNLKQPTLRQKNLGRYFIFRHCGASPLFANRLVAVRYALSSSEWDFIRWVASAQGGWL